jgi:hypothetical protein
MVEKAALCAMGALKPALRAACAAIDLDGAEAEAKGSLEPVQFLADQALLELRRARLRVDMVKMIVLADSQPQ